jgi:hypothetical protein
MYGSSRRSNEHWPQPMGKDQMIPRGAKVVFLAAAIVAYMSAAAAEDLQKDQQVRPDAIANPLAALSLDRLTATQERPLFAPGRRRPVVAAPAVVAAPPPPAPPEPPKFTLYATLIGEQEAEAVIRTESGGKIVRVRVGDDVGGWQITEIAARQVVIERHDRSLTVAMFQGPHESAKVARVHPMTRIFEVNARGVLRSNPIAHNY